MAFQALKMAWSSIISNKMRSFLTMLGIIIGVMALIVLVSVVDGATKEVTDVVTSLGTNLLSIQIQDDKGRPIHMNDLEELRSLENLAEIAPSGNDLLAIRCGTEEGRALVSGTTPAFNIIEHQVVEYGRSLNEADVSNHLNVAIINPALARDILKSDSVPDAIGREFHLGGIPFKVIGIFEEEDEAESMFSISSYSAQIPYTSLIRISNTVYDVKAILASAVSDEKLDSLEKEMGQWLLHRFDNDEKAFTIINMSTIMSAMDRITGTMAALLGGIAAISLVVGGIGIMNIMLVSVTERTREIGIRKAIGAGQGSILLQFLIEALMLSLMGCALGVAISYTILKVINIVSGHSFAMKPDVVILATVFSLIIGVIFGIYPARKAAKKKPIDALHYGG